MRRFLIPLFVLLYAAAVFGARTPVPKKTPTPASVKKISPSKVLPQPSIKKKLKFAAPTAGTAASLLYTMSASLRIVSDPNAYGPDDATQRSIATQELNYLGLQHARTDFTCDQAIWGGGCDPRNLISTYFNTFPADYWDVMPFTSGSVAPGDVTGFQIPNLTHFGNTIHSVEVGNEANNLTFTYNGIACGQGQSTWAGCAQFARDYYTAATAQFPGIPVFSWKNPFAMPDNVLLQFTGPFTPSGDPTLADLADVHNYVQGNGYNGPVDFVVTQAFETGTGGSDDGMTGNFCGSTVSGNFPAVPIAQCPNIPRVASENGVELGAPNTSEEARAAMIVNTFIIGYIKGWSYISIYAVADDTSNFGLFQNPSNGTAGTPYQAATAIHNFTTIMNDPVGTAFTPNTTCPSIVGNGSSTDYVICGQFYNGMNWLIATGDRPQGEAVEHWNVAVPANTQIYDVLSGTASIGTGGAITVDDHAVIMIWSTTGATPTPTPTLTPTATPFTPTPTPTPSGVPSMTVTPTPTMAPPTPTPTVLPTLTPTATPTMAFQFPSNPTVGQIVVGPAGQRFQWDGVKWVALGGAGGGGGGGGGISSINNDTTAAQLIVGSGGIVINTANGTTTVDGSGISGGGGGGAPPVNPPGGANNYAPIDSPIFTGPITLAQDATTPLEPTTLQQVQAMITAIPPPTGFAPIANPTFTGIVTLGQDAVAGRQAVTYNQLIQFVAALAPISNPTFTGTITSPGGTWNSDSLNVTTLNGLLFSGTPMGGSCPTDQFVNSLDSTGHLFCAPVPTAANNAFPNILLTNVDSPSIYWGTMTAPVASMASLGGMNLSAGMHFDSPSVSWIADAANASDFAEGSATFDFYANTGLTSGSPFSPTHIAALNAGGFNLLSGQFMVNGVPIGASGLPVNNPTFTGVMTGPMGPTSFRIGDMDVTSSQNGSYNLTAGLTFNGTNWISNTGGPFIILNSVGNQMNFSTALARTVGQPIPPAGWFPRMRIDANGVSVSHLVNLPMASLPSVQNGTLMAGSQDSFGYILASGWPVTLHFAYFWQGNPACVATGAAGTPGVYYTNAQVTGSIQFGCVDYVGGNPCAPGWFAYHCGDVGQ